MIGGFQSILFISAFGFMTVTVTIMIDGSVKRHRKFDFKLQSSHVIENCYNQAKGGSFW